MSRFYHLEFLTSFCNRFVLGFYSAAALAFEWLLNKSRTQIAWQAMIMAEAKRKKFILKLWQNEKKKKKKKKLMKWREKIVSRIAQNLFACKSMPGHFFLLLHRLVVVVDSLHLLTNFAHCSLFVALSQSAEALFHEWHCNRNCAWHRFNRKTYCHCDDKQIFFFCWSALLSCVIRIKAQ